MYKERYKKEAKDIKLKNNYNYDKVTDCEKMGIKIQVTTMLFLDNMKQIIRLKEEKI